MTQLFRNSSPDALTLKQAAEQAKKRLIERGRQMRQARELAARGRGSDTEVAHVARGEYVIPEAMQTPEVRAVLRRAAGAYGVPLEMLSVGNAMNRINPNTGAPEFGVMDWISGLFGQSAPPSSPPKNTTIVLPNVGINNEGQGTSEANLGFDPNGPSEWGMAMRHPLDAIAAKKAADQAMTEERENRLINSHNDGGDAWRHARWNQLMTQSIGPEMAKQFSDAHERSSPNPRSETLMDLYNNQMGRNLAGDSSPELALQNALSYGYLRRSPFTR
jgi:hypothetical protein